ncbi:MAG: quinone-dependent dihydroorotate dehydrogenase [SAR324 cluster bacterium]|nr:quinone-dependent dihydroorotate dehydrogenase [SAR324 cluster bacterium]
MYRFIRPILFSQDPETVHEKVITALEKSFQIPGVHGLIESFFGFEHPELQIEIFGKTFPNPIGLAAGFDKNGKVFNPMFSIGFGFVEIGTVTPLPQPGNPAPRIFRLPEDQALINRLGFNNQGVEALIHRVEQNPPSGILGINIGKNKSTPIEAANNDYTVALEKIYDHAGYIVINVSSPNTEKLRALQEKDALHSLMGQLLQIRKDLIRQGKPKKTILLKIAPDLTDETLEDIRSIFQEFALDGIIACNTTLSRDRLKNSKFAHEQGGLSGVPLRERSTQLIGKLYQKLGPSLPIIGVGGIFTGGDAYQKIKAGASLVQIYTGMIYQGPAIVYKIKNELLRLLKRDGFSHISEAVGADFR